MFFFFLFFPEGNVKQPYLLLDLPHRIEKKIEKSQKSYEELPTKQFNVIPKRKINTFSMKSDDYHLTSLLWCGSFGIVIYFYFFTFDNEYYY